MSKKISMENIKTLPTVNYVKDTFEEYLSKKDHISASDIKNFLHSPRYYFYKAFEEIKEPNKTTERHFPIGSALHELVLEQELFKTNYIVAPKFDMRTTAGKQGYAEFLATSNGKTILFMDEYEMVIKMGVSASKNETFLETIDRSHAKR